ncbi:MAG: Ktr system potassium uptake protein A [Planctomycetes bacterium]|nr:Ktr system potassium uptake protein A [Planctomycetota bacterium]
MKKKKVLVIGLGRFGTAIVESLWRAQGIETVAVDESSDAVDEIKAAADASYVGDGTDAKVLHGIGAAECDVAVVTFGENFEGTVMAVAELKRLGIKEIVARASNQSRAAILKAVGATRVLQLETEMGRRVAVELVTPIAADLLEFAHAHQLHPWVAQGELVGSTLAKAELRKRFGITVLGYRRANAPFEVAGPTYQITAGDVLMLVGETRAIQKFVTQMESA